jgi:hypothetical protein
MVLRAPDGCSRALERGRRPRAVLATVALCAVLMLWCALFIHVLTEFPRTQWDFGSLYFGAKSFFLGLDPYEKDNLSSVAGERQPYPYTQTLACAYLLYPFTWVDFHSAWCAWYVVRAVLLVALARLWWRLIGRSLSLLLFCAVLLLGFNAAIGWDLVAGNKSIIEQLLLWWGIDHYLRGRWSRFAVLTSAAGVFNIMPAALLGLVLGAPTSWPQRLKSFTLGVVVFLLLVGGPFLAHREMLASYIRVVNQVHETGWINPCVLAVIDHVGEKGRLGIAPVFQRYRWFLWGACVLAVLSVSAGSILQAIRHKDRQSLVLLGVVLYALCVPRLKPYSYMILLPPALAVLAGLRDRPLLRAIVVALLCLPGFGNPVLASMGADMEALVHGGARFAVHYYPLFTAVLVWIALIWRARSGGCVADSGVTWSCPEPGDSHTG